jgi:shikimate kinase
MNLFLIGYRCAGKSVVGKRLARSLAWPFVDLDAEIVKESRMEIPEIVSRKGWEWFRNEEKRVVRKIASRDFHIVATGGGAVLDPGNVRVMREKGKLIWLRVRPETVMVRLRNDPGAVDARPALTSKGLYGEIGETLSIRSAIYEKAADVCVDTDGKSVRRIVEEILPTIQPLIPAGTKKGGTALY